MSLAEAIKETMNARQLQTADVARRLGEGYDRATFYRLLNGATTEPRLNTLLGLCKVLEVSPTELLQLARLWPFIERPADPLDIRLRDCFAHFQSLPPDDKWRAVTVVTALAAAWEKPLDTAEARGSDVAPEGHAAS